MYPFPYTPWIRKTGRFIMNRNLLPQGFGGWEALRRLPVARTILLSSMT
jgi:hypothetical protein